MTSLFDRPSFPVTLPDGRECRVQRVGGAEYAEALRAAQVEHNDAFVGATDSNVRYWSTLCFYGIVAHDQPDIAAIASALTTSDLKFIAERIEYRSELADDPDKPAGQLAWDEPMPTDEGSEAAIDPMVDEFPEAEYAPSTDVGSDGAGLSGVALPPESVGGGVGGVAAVDGGASGGEPEASGVADG